MKLRQILIVLSLLTFFSVIMAGYLYNSSLEESAFQTAEKEVALQAVRIQNTISSYLSENLKSVKALAGIEDIQQSLLKKSSGSLKNANTLLDHFKDSLNVDVCYLIDNEGNTIASSNRGAPDSFVGKNFSFRPYWKEAVKGNPGTYMALGVTSKKRGVYHSYPVYDESGSSLLGVAVIKSPVDIIEEEFSSFYEGTVLLIDPHGVVFLTNRPEWLFRSLWELSEHQIEEINESQQFGKGPWELIGMAIGEGNIAVDESGEKFVVYQLDVENYPGWNLIYFLSLDLVSRRVSDPLIRATGPIILTVCLLVGLSVFYLYRRASRDLIKRREAEEALLEAKEVLSSYSRDLERQVKDRTQEITSILKYTPAVVYIKGKDGHYTFINSKHEELFGIPNEDIKGKTDYDIFPRPYADRFWENDLKVFMEGEPTQVEEAVPLSDGVHTYLSVKFPVYDEEGITIGVCGISTDITEIKRAQDQLRRLSDSIIESQEKERTAVSRELHDELGQVLTALRMDSVWLRDRLKGEDREGTERAQAMSDLIDNAIDEVRGMATRLRPGVLDDLGLIDALDWFTSDFEKRTDITIIFQHENVPLVKDALATAAYRIAQEALTNVVRHADATHVEISLLADNGNLTLSVLDNGRGFELAELSDSEGIGMAGMRERASLVNGTLEITSKPGEGTDVHFHAPLDMEGGSLN